MANFNSGKYIKDAIESIINQTYHNWELIIVDDCSTDNSIDIINSYLHDARIKLIRLDRNHGVGFTKKTACENASNDILGILDADDKLEKNALEILAIEYRNEPEYGFIYTNLWSCDSELKNCKLNTMDRSIPDKTSLFNPTITHFKTFRRKDYEKTPGYDPNLKAAVDKDIIYKMEEISKFKYLPEPLYYYRQHENGISQGKNKLSVRVYHYIAKLNAYNRRLNTNIPNLSRKALFFEFLKLTLNKQIKALRYLDNLIRIPKIIEYFDSIFYRLPTRLKKLIEKIS
ncbi:MAG: glycosyltransferase family 2 protein [Candidatus Hermodarchaeota archaeon]